MFSKHSDSRTHDDSGASQRAADALVRRLEERSRELDEQAVELIARRGELDAQAEHLARDRRDLEAREQALIRKADQIERQLQELRAEHEQALKVVAGRVEAVRKQEQELERRVALARDEVLRQRSEIEELRRQAQAHADEAQAVHERMQAELAEWEQRKAAIQTESAALAARQRSFEEHKSAVDAQQASFDTQRAELDEISRRQGRQEGAIAAREAAVVKREAESQAALARREAEGAKALGEREAQMRASLVAREAEVRAVLEAREEEIKATAADLERRIAKAREEAVRQRAEIQGLHAAADARLAEARAGYQKMADERAVWDEQAARLRARAEELSEQGTVLDRREAELAHERARLDAQLQQIQQGRQELRAQRGELSRERAELDLARGEMGQQQRQLDKRVVEQQKEQVRLDKLREELLTRRARIQAGEAALAKQQTDLNTAARKLEDAEDRFKRHCEDVEAEFQRKREAVREEIRQWKEAVQKELAEQRRRNEAELLEKRTRGEAELAAERARLQAEIARQQAEVRRDNEIVAGNLVRVQEFERTLNQRRSELDVLADQLAERDAEARQRGLSLELQAEELARRATAVELGEEELDALRREREHDFDELRTSLARRAEAIEQSEASMLAAPRLWWLRASGIAAVAAIAVISGWLIFERPVHRAASRMPLTTTARYVERALREHMGALVSSEAVSQWLDNASLAGAWRAAVEAHRAQPAFVLEPPAIEVACTGEYAEPLADLVRQVGQAYLQHVNSVEPTALLPAAYADLEARRNHAWADLESARKRRTESASLLSMVPSPQRRDELLAELRELRQAHAQAVRSLDEQRARLSTLQGGGPVTGVVDPAEFQRALAADAMYEADRDEFDAAIRGYRAELAVGMVPLGPAMEEMAATLASMAASLNDQKQQQLPIELAAAIEECAGLISGFQARLAQSGKHWEQLREKLAAVGITDDAAPLLSHQSASSEAAVQVSGEAGALIAQLAARIAPAGGSSGGTRELVVLAALRGELAKLEAVGNRARDAAQSATLAGNFRLDALDRRVRGVSQRLRERETLIRDQLQQRADRLASQDRDAALAGTRAEVNRLEAQRETLVTSMIDNMDALRGLDDDVLERRQLEAHIAGDDREIARLETQVAWLDGQLAEARRSGPQPDRLAMSEPSVELTGGVHRLRNAALAGGLTFAGMWLLCVGMILKNPFRTRQSPAPGPLSQGTGEPVHGAV